MKHFPQKYYRQVFMSLSHVALIVLTMAIWGFNFVAIKVALLEMSPLALCFFRFLFASIPAIFFVKIPKIPFRLIVIYALLMFVGQFALLFTSMKLGLSAGLAATLLQMQLFFTILFAVIFIGERPKPWQLFGALISFMGIVQIGTHAETSSSMLGFIMIILAAASMGAGNLVSKKLIGRNRDMLSLVIWSSAVSCPVYLILYLLFDNSDITSLMITNISWLTVLAMLYTVYASTLIGYSVWTKLLGIYPVAIVTPYSMLAPIFAMLSSVLILGETLEPWKITACSLVIGGIGVNIFGSRFWPKRSKILPVGV